MMLDLAMGDDDGAFLVMVLLVSVLCTANVLFRCICKCAGLLIGGAENHEEHHQQPTYSQLYHMRHRGDHDDQKHMHATQADAEKEIRRMRNNPHLYDECEKLNSYYNADRQGWFVGRSNRK